MTDTSIKNISVGVGQECGVGTMVQGQGTAGAKAWKPDTGWKRPTMVEGEEPSGWRCQPGSLDSSPE